MTKRNRQFTAKDIAYPALMCALLLGGQYIFSFVAGVEIVTVLLVCFSAAFGARRGVVCATAFSLLRCLIFGFYPNIVLLYLIYYPALAALFGGLGHLKKEAFAKPLFAVIINVLLLGIACACLLLNVLDAIQISRLMKTTITVLLWVTFALTLALWIAFNALLTVQRIGKKNAAELVRLVVFTALSATCTVCFTLLDDVITPLFYGYTRGAALAYFYTSFTAMLPQTVCTVVTVGLLFLPLTRALETVKGKGG
ncbi:MAG: hypothetical protein K2K12_06800 [Clostridia bacterium]|nr:hypothetical protein [Clostridia bacterium]